MKNFRTYELAMSLYKKCNTLVIKNPILRDQFQRATLSIVLNLAEGSGKLTPKDRRRFYSIAMGSLRETQALLTILNQPPLQKTSDTLAAHIYKLIQNPGSNCP